MRSLFRSSLAKASFDWARHRLRPSSRPAWWIAFFVTCFSLGHGLTATTALANPLLVREVLTRCAEAHTQLLDYRGIVQQEIWETPSTLQREVIAVLFQKPASLYLRWQEGIYQDTELLTRYDWNQGNLLIQLGGWFSYLTVNVHPTEVGEPFITLTKDLREWLAVLSNLARRPASDRVFRFIDAHREEVPGEAEKVVLEVPAFLIPFRDDSVFIYQFVIELERGVPVEMVLRGVDGEVRQRISYIDLQINVGVPEETFNPQNPQFDFRAVPRGEAEIDLQGFFHNWQRRYGEIADYIGVLVMEEQQGTERRREQMEFKFRKPFDVYLNWQGNRSLVLEALYREGWNKERIRVRTDRWGVPLIGDFDSQSYLARRGYHHPITEFGLNRLIERVQRQILQGWLKEHLGVRFNGVQRCDSQPCYELEFFFPVSQWRAYPYSRIILFWNISQYLPVKGEMYGWLDPANPRDLDPYERYEFLNLKTNVALTEQDFDPANSEYHFVLFPGLPWLDRLLTGRE